MTVQDAVSVQALAACLDPRFVLGVASAAFQIEGSLAAGGRGPSGWDAFAEKPGSILEGHSPAVACTTTTGRPKTSSSCAPSASTPTASPSRGPGSSRTGRGFQRGRPGLLRPPDRPAAGRRNLPHGHPVPLGHAAAPRASRRLDEPLDGGALRRVLRGGRQAASGTGWRSG